MLVDAGLSPIEALRAGTANMDTLVALGTSAAYGLSVALLLAGCSTPNVGQASSSGGIVNSYGWQPNKALAVAQAHCEKFGRDAVVTSRETGRTIALFRCTQMIL